jgi:hypothetical protein
VTSVVAAVAATLALTVQQPAMAHASASAPPQLTDGFGLTQIPTESTYTSTNTAYDFVITVSTPQVAGVPGLDNGGHHIRIVLPADYYATPTKRYPVLYLLNGSTPGADPASYFTGFKAVNSTSGMISVMPDGGPRGWYANWLNQNSAAGAQNWENFHIDQVIPFIDANLRSIPDKAAVPGTNCAGLPRAGRGGDVGDDRPPAQVPRRLRSPRPTSTDAPGQAHRGIPGSAVRRRWFAGVILPRGITGGQPGCTPHCTLPRR